MPAEIKSKEEKEQMAEFTNCLLSQYRFCAAGIGLGAAYGIRSKKGLAPMLVTGVAGTFADFVYGYTIACRKEAEMLEAKHSIN